MKYIHRNWFAMNVCKIVNYRITIIDLVPSLFESVGNQDGFTERIAPCLNLSFMI
jgi:hypothetical protein